jgi:hypothetical protein
VYPKPFFNVLEGGVDDVSTCNFEWGVFSVFGGRVDGFL